MLQLVSKKIRLFSNMVKVIKTTKLFYNQYPFKISYKRLYGIPDRQYFRNITWALNTGPNGQQGGMIPEEDRWWFDYPETNNDKQRRNNCYKFLKSLNVKFNNGSMTHVYFLNEEDFKKALTRYKDLQIEICKPFIKNLAELHEKYKTNVEFKKNLYHKKYRYKVLLKYNEHLENNLGRTLWELYCDNSNYHLNPSVRRFSPTASNRINTISGISYAWRHGPYHTYAVYCKEKIDLDMFVFTASENVTKVVKAILKEELDK